MKNETSSKIHTFYSDSVFFTQLSILYVSFNFTKQVHVDSCIFETINIFQEKRLLNKIYVSVKHMLPINYFNTSFLLNNSYFNYQCNEDLTDE